MGRTITIITLLAVLVAVVMYGAWYIADQYGAYEREQVQNIFGNQNEDPAPRGTITTGTDPFGLFGANEVEYEIVFNTAWDDFSHPNYHTGAAHFSEPVIWTGTQNPVFALGRLASAGVKELAETGRTRQIKRELEQYEESRQIEWFGIYDRVDTPGRDTYKIKLDRQHPNLSFVSMLAPSPDWFVAIDNLSMISDGRWRDSFSVALPVLDAGTEEGKEFTINNEATDPVKPIGIVKDIPVNDLPAFATVTFKRIEKELQTVDVEEK